MAEQNNPNPKHIRSFWPIVIIFVLASIVGGVVYWFQFQLVNDYDLQSMELRIHKRSSEPTTKTTKPKTTTPIPTK
jgi:hypothetical protein